jgi:hypothetical protein
MIEHVLGGKVKPNSIRRTKRGSYSIVDEDDFSLSDQDKEVIKEITCLFLPLFKPQK